MNSIRPPIWLLLVAALGLTACSQLGGQGPSEMRLVLWGEGRGALVEVTYDASALRYLGAESPYALEAHATPGRVRVAAVSPSAPTGPLLALRFEVQRPGVRPTVRVLETYPEGQTLRESWQREGPVPQALILPQAVVQGLAQGEANPSFVQNPLGDLNNSGGISLVDGVLLADVLAGTHTPTAYQRYHGDLNSSGTLTTQDLALLLRKLVNPDLEANLEVAPLDLVLTPGGTAYVLLGNSGWGSLPTLTYTKPEGIALTDVTPSGAAGRAYQVQATGNTLEGSLQFQAGSAGTRTVRVHAPYPDFRMTLSAPSLTLTPGSNGTLSLTLTPENGFTGTVSLSLIGAPAGVGLSPSSVAVSGSGPVSETLTVSVGPGVAQGTYDLRVRGTAGSLSHEVPLTLVVVTTPGFTFYLDQGSLTLQADGTGNLQALFSTYGGFSGPVSLSLVNADGSPSALGLTPSSVTLPASGPVPLTVSAAGAPAGSYSLRVRATGGSHTEERPLNVTIYDFGLSAQDLTLEQGSAGTLTVTLNRQHFTGPVSLALSGSPLGTGTDKVAYSFSENPATGESVLLHLSVGPAVSANTYTLTLTGTGGGLTRTATFTLTVTPAPKALRPTLLGRSGNTYTVGVDLVGTTDPYRGAQFTVELPSGFTLSATTGGLTGGCILDYAQVSSSPNRWNVALVCGSTFQGPGQLLVLTVTGTGGGTLALQSPLLVKPDYQEDGAEGGSLNLAP